MFNINSYIKLMIVITFLILSPLHAKLNHQLPENIDRDWWSQASQYIAESEYEIRWHSEYQSPNRAQNLRFRYYLDGFKVMPRVDEDMWSMAMKLTGFGRADAMSSFTGKSITIDKRTGYVVGNGVDIAFENSEKGMREDFVIQKKVLSQGELMLLFSVFNQNLLMEVERDEIHFVINEPGGAEILRYGDMEITDSQGMALDGYFKAIDENRFAIVVHDHDAVYPIVIDPLSSTPDWTAESNQAEACIGSSVSTAGDVNGDGYSDVIVGAPWYDNGQNDEGRVFVYHGSIGGLSATPDWTGEPDHAGACFGYSVSTAGDVNGDGYSDIIVGAPMYDNGQAYEGGAFVFHGSAGGLSATPDWIKEPNQYGALFGVSVSTAGDVNGDGYSDVIVGAPGYDNGQTDEGGAFVYHGSAGGLSAMPDWTGESDQESAEYGNSVSSAGDVNGDGYSDIIIGAHLFDWYPDAGLAYAYYGSAGGLSTTPDQTMGQMAASGAEYGFSVSTAGDVNGDGYSDVIVGAPLDGYAGQAFGYAWLYYGSASGLPQVYDEYVHSDQLNSRFGCSVSAGDVNGDGYSDIVVGASHYDNGQIDEGRGYVYYGSAGGLNTTPDWTAESDQADAWFGRAVSVTGDVNGDGYSDVIVGAPGYDNGQNNEGRAFVYHGSADGIDTMSVWATESNEENAYLGVSVSTAGDVNGDGYSDVIVGATEYDNDQTQEGRAFVYHGSAEGLPSTPDWTAEGDQAYARLGNSVSSAGDVNGDGYSDIIVGASHYDNGQSNEGRAYVYHGSAGGLSSTPDWTAEGDQASAYYGNSVSTAGDVNGDGYSDVIVGAYWFDNGQNNEGRAYVYHGSAGGLSSTPDWTAESDQADAWFGVAVSTAGDVNGDGYSDVIVGAPWFDNGQNNEGRAFVYHGSADGLSSAPDWTAEPDQVDAELGCSVSTAGDVNGDGYSDVIIGAYGYDNGQAYEGRAFVYHGSASGLSTTPDWIAEPDQAYARFGCAVYTAGDVNGDGYSDVIVGAYMFDNGQNNEGRAYVYHGSAGGLSSTPDWTAESDQADAWFGVSVSTAGDVNGDGYSDVIIGALLYDNGQNDEGGAFVYCGNEGNNVMVQPRQLRDDFSRQIVPPLFTHSNNAFGVQFWGRSVYGRVLAKAQFEVKELGIPFNGSGLFETDWVDLDTTGMEISRVLGGFVADKLYKWRARIKYHLKYGAPIHSRWYYLQSNGMTECDLRVGIETSVNECALATLYPGLRLSVMYVPRGVKFVCNVPVVMGDGDFIVYNLLGAEIDRIDMSLGKVGEYDVEWSGQDRNGNVLPGGVYFARVRTGGAVSNTVKFILIK